MSNLHNATDTIRTEREYDRALARLDVLWGAAPGTPEAAELDRLADRISAYEAAQRAEVLPPPEPGPVIASKLRELGWSQRELAKRLGWGSGRVSEIISGKRRLTLAMVRDLSCVLEIDPSILVRAAEPDHVTVSVRVPADLASRARAQGFAGHGSLDELVASLLAQRVPEVDPELMVFPARPRSRTQPACEVAA